MFLFYCTTDSQVLAAQHEQRSRCKHLLLNKAKTSKKFNIFVFVSKKKKKKKVFDRFRSNSENERQPNIVLAKLQVLRRNVFLFIVRINVCVAKATCQALGSSEQGR